jgi:hypothetical protein
MFFVWFSTLKEAVLMTKVHYVRFEVSTAVTMMIIIFWEMIIIKVHYGILHSHP